MPKPPHFSLQSFVNTHGRVQRLSDGGSYNASLKSANENSFEVTITTEEEFEEGDAMRFEFFGANDVICMTGVLHEIKDFTWRFVLVGPPHVREDNLNTKLKVAGVSANCTWSGGIESGEVCEVHRGGFVATLPLPVAIGSQVQTAIKIGSRVCNATGICRQCSADKLGRSYLVDIEFTEIAGPDEATWNSLFHSNRSAA